LKTVSDELSRTASFRLFHARGSVTVQARSLIVERRVSRLMTQSTQTTPSFKARDREDGILQIARCGPVYTLVNQYAQLVLDTLRQIRR